MDTRYIIVGGDGYVDTHAPGADSVAMARVYHESFDAVGTSNSYLASKWSALGGAFQSTISGTIQAGSARTGTNGFRPIVASNMYLAAQTEFYVGFAIRFTFLPTSYFWVDGETTATEGHVRLVTSGGKIQAQIATTPYAVLGTGSRTLIVNNWYYVEIRHLVNQTTGRVVVKVDGVTEIDFTGDTQGVPANGNIALIQWLLGTAGTDFDDIYINDTTGSESNGFDGDQRIYAVFADGAGNYAQWDPSAGANWQNVDDNPPDDDTTYNDTPVANEKDSFTFADVAPSPALTSISAVQAMYYARRADASAATFRRLYRRGGTDYTGSTQTLADAFAYFLDPPLELDPVTGAPWTVANFNAGEWGYESL